MPTLNVGKYRAKNKNMKLYQNNNIQIFHSRILPIRHPKPPTRLFVSLTGRLFFFFLIQLVNRTSYFLITDLYSFKHLNYRRFYHGCSRKQKTEEKQEQKRCSVLFSRRNDTRNTSKKQKAQIKYAYGKTEEGILGFPLFFAIITSQILR